MKDVTMQIVNKVDEIARKKGYYKDGKVDTAKLANEYLKIIGYQADSDKERRKKYRSIYFTFRNFFDPSKNWTNVTLNKLCVTLGITAFFVESKNIH